MTTLPLIAKMPSACQTPAYSRIEHCSLLSGRPAGDKARSWRAPMLATSEIAKLKREIATLRDIVGQSRPGTKNPMSSAERLSLKSEIDRCILELDELRGKLSQ